jgi:hypothetical protein
VRGEVVHMSLFDLGSELDLARVQRMLGRTPELAPIVSKAKKPDYPFPAPREVRFTQDEADVEVRIHAVGVAAVRLRIPFDSPGIAELAGLRDRLRVRGKPLAEAALSYLQELRPDLQDAVVEPYPALVEPESYLVFCVVDGDPAEMLGPRREEVAALIAGEPMGRLVPAIVESALRHTLRYYKDDLAIVGWDHALVLGPPGQYEEVLDVMELANLQLLELRTYDAYLDERLDASFSALDRLWARGGLFRSARTTLQEMSALRVDFARLTDNLHETGKLFGEWYVAKLHARLRDAFHLGSWEKAVATKMRTLEDMFQLAEQEANHRRGIVLESLIVLLFIADLGLIFLLQH